MIQVPVYTVVAIIAAIILGYLAWYVWKYRTAPGALYFCVFLLACAHWMLFSGVGIFVDGLAAKIWALQILFAGNQWVPTLWFFFAVSYSRVGGIWRSPLLRLLWLVPAAVVALELTNQWHGLIWTDLSLASTPFGVTLVREHGILGWLNIFVSYPLILTGFGLILWAAFKTFKKNRVRAFLLVLTSFIAFLFSASSFLGAGIWGNLDITPLFFPILGAIYAWGIFDQRMFELVPVARNIFIRSMGHGLLVLDAEGTLADINPAARRMLNAPANPAGMPADAALARWPQLAGCWRGSAGTTAEVLLEGQEGGRWVDAQVSSLHDDKGVYHGRAIALWDITGRKQVEETLRQNEANLVKAQRIASIGNYTWDFTRNIIACSDELRRIFDIVPGEPVTTELFLARVHPDDHEAFNKTIQKAIENRNDFNMDFRVLGPDGTVHMVHAEGEMGLDGAGKAVQLFGTVQDLTERIRAEEALKDAKARAELYLDLMSHDINNMNTVGKGFIELALASPEIDGKGREYLLKAMGSLENTTRLIENVGMMQQAQSREMKLFEVDASQIIKQVIVCYSNMPVARATFSCDIPSSCMVVANAFLYDVFENLVSNAIKHAGPGREIVVRVDKATVDGRAFYRFIFEDDGYGIPDDLKENIFKRFQRGNTMARGKGLGLYLVQSFVESYQGQVWVDDRVKGDHTKGARFVVMLPAAYQ